MNMKRNGFYFRGIDLMGQGYEDYDQTVTLRIRDFLTGHSRNPSR